MIRKKIKMVWSNLYSNVVNLCEYSSPANSFSHKLSFASGTLMHELEFLVVVPASADQHLAKVGENAPQPIIGGLMPECHAGLKKLLAWVRVLASTYTLEFHKDVDFTHYGELVAITHTFVR